MSCTRVLSGSVLQLCNETMRDDKQIVLSALENYPTALQFASYRLRDGES
jgi:hypothetical protein